MPHLPDNNTAKEILLRQPSFVLELSRYWDGKGEARHRFAIHPAYGGKPCLNDAEGTVLLAGEGHEVSRRDMHYALYLFQRFHVGALPSRQRMNA